MNKPRGYLIFTYKVCWCFFLYFIYEILLLTDRDRDNISTDQKAKVKKG